MIARGSSHLNLVPATKAVVFKFQLFKTQEFPKKFRTSFNFRNYGNAVTRYYRECLRYPLLHLSLELALFSRWSAGCMTAF
jgi:hypothetical protein